MATVGFKGLSLLVISGDRECKRTYFSGAINVVDAEDRAEAVQEDFSERWDQLGGRHQYVDRRRPTSAHQQTSVR